MTLFLNGKQMFRNAYVIALLLLALAACHSPQREAHGTPSQVDGKFVTKNRNAYFCAELKGLPKRDFGILIT